MTDDPTVAAPAEPPPERVRVNSDPPAGRGVAPVVYLAGLIVLAVAVFFLWRYPTTPRRVSDDSNRLTAVQAQVEALSGRLAKLETQTAPDLAPLDARIAKLEARSVPDLAPLDARVAALQARSVPDLAPLVARIASLESRPAPPPPDLGPVNGRIDALARDAATSGSKRDGELAALGKRLDAMTDLGSKIDALDTRLAAVERDQKAVSGLAGRAERTARVQAASAALDAGRPLGPIPDAPPALARFAIDAPPTEASLRLGFPAAADAAHTASQPAITSDQNFLQRAWTTATQAVTVRQGDRVMVGDPIAGVLAHAQDLLDAGDLAGCLRVLGQLAGPAQAAMAGWTAQARSLLDARAALAGMAAQG